MRPRKLRYRWSFAVLGAALILFFTVTGAQGGDPRGVWVSTAFQILNVEPFPQTFTARFLDPRGNVAGVMTDTLPAGAARFYPSLDHGLPVPPTFSGTLAVSATGQVALEILHLDPITGGNTILETVAEEAVGPTAHTPINRCIVFLVHNPNPNSMVSMELLAFDSNGNPAGTWTDNIPPEGLLRIDPLLDLGLPWEFSGSAVLRASLPIQVTVIFRCGGLSAFVAPAGGSRRLFLPHLPPSLPGLVTPTLTIRNLGTIPAEGEILYASGVTEPLSLPLNGSVAVVPPPVYFIYLPLVGKAYGTGNGTALSLVAAARPPSDSAVISMTAPVAAVVQIADNRAYSRGTLAYRAFAFEQATPAVALPLLLAGYQGWWTDSRIWVRNMGEVTTTVQMRYVTVPTGTVVWGQLDGLRPGEVAQVSMPPLPDGADRAAAIFLADQPIVALAGAFHVQPDVGDRHLRYGGINFNFACIRIAEADFSWSPLTPTVGYPLAFNWVVSPISATWPISFTWSFGDGTYGTGDYVWHTYQQTGTYVVAMTATNCLGFGRAVVHHTLTVVPQINLFSSYSVLPPIPPQPLTLPTVFQNYYGWNSHLAVESQTSGTITAMVNFFQGITPVHALSSTIPPYSSWFLEGTSLPPGFQGEAVVDASGSFFAVDNQVGPGAAVAYHGLAVPSTTLYCPELCYDDNGWSSSLDVYNPYQVATTVTVNYSDGVSRMAVLGPGEHGVFRQSDEGHLPGSRFGGVVTAEQPVMALCSHAHPLGGARLYEAATGGLTTAYVPYLACSPSDGTGTTLFLMNPGGISATVQIFYTGYITTAVIAPGETLARPTCVDLPSGYEGGAVLESTAPVIPLVFIDMPAGPGDPYSAYDVSMAPHSTLFFPMAPKNVTDTLGYTWNAILALYNTSTSTATIGMTFYDASGTPYTPIVLEPDQTNPFFLPPRGVKILHMFLILHLPDGRFSAVAQSDQPLVGMVMLWGHPYGPTAKRSEPPLPPAGPRMR